jgi:Phage tail assembly chaperone proteins, E, or 41 or 14
MATTTQPTVELKKTITLLVPIKTPAGEITSITLRRPKVSEMVRFQSQAKDLRLGDAEEELLIYANLSEEKLTMEDIGELDFGDFAKLQRWFRSLQTGA